MRRRGADSPRSASPIGPAPTRLPRIALPLATVVTPCVMVPRSESAFRFAASASVDVRPNARPVMGVTPAPRRSPHDRPRPKTRTEHGALRTECAVCRCRPTSALHLHQNAEHDNAREPEQTDHDGDPVEVALGDRGAADGGLHAATEHVGETAALPLV